MFLKLYAKFCSLESKYYNIAKLVKDDKPRHDRKRATETEKQLKGKEVKRLALEKGQKITNRKSYERKRS